MQRVSFVLILFLGLITGCGSGLFAIDLKSEELEASELEDFDTLGLTLADPISGSNRTSSSQTVSLNITEDRRIAFWCVSETQNSKPYSVQNCGSKKFETSRPTEFLLSPSNGLKTIYLWTADRRGRIRSRPGVAQIYLDFPSEDAPAPDTIADSPTNCSITKCFYVRSGANGSGNNWSDALGAIPSSLVRGATYLVADGNYGSYVFNQAEAGDQWIRIKKAISKDHGTDTGWQESYGDGQAVFGDLYYESDYYEFNGQKRNESNWQDSESYGFHVNSVTARCDSCLESGRSISDRADNIKVKFVDMGKHQSITDYQVMDRGFGIYYGDHQNVYLGYSYIHNTGVPIYFCQVTGAVVEYNFVGPTWGKEAIRGACGVKNVVVRFNKFVDTGHYAGPTTGLTAEIGVWDGGAYHNWEIYGNIFWNTAKGQDILHNDASIMGGSDLDEGADNWKVHNNIFGGFSEAGNNGGVMITGNNQQVFDNIWSDVATTIIGIKGQPKNNWCYSPRKPSLCQQFVEWYPGNQVGRSDPFVNAFTLDFRLRFNVLGIDPLWVK